jgi:hypothetical protein
MMDCVSLTIAAASQFSWITVLLWVFAGLFLAGVVRAYRWAMRRDDEAGDGDTPMWRKYRL